MANEKQCNKCKEVKPSNDFHKQKRAKDGLKSQCKVCIKATHRQRYQENPEYRETLLVRDAQRRADQPNRNKDYYVANTERLKAIRDTHKEETAVRARKYYTANKDKIAATTKRWKQANSGKVAAYEAKRRAAKLHRTPAWSETEAIIEFYEKCPEGMVVDHIIPLQGEEVSGFHVLSNLQYLTPVANLEKSNKLLEEYRDGTVWSVVRLEEI